MALQATSSVKIKNGKKRAMKTLKCDPETVASKDDDHMYGTDHLNIGAAVHKLDNDS